MAHVNVRPMLAPNTHTDYGATSSAPQPPPYAGFDRPTMNSEPRSPSGAYRGLERTLSWMDSRFFAMLVTFIITLSFCVSTMPVTYCNDPADPEVRERFRQEWNMEFLEHEKLVAQREIVKAQWKWEDDEHAAQLREWEQERIQHKKELEERAQREEEERKRLNLFWGRVETHQCKTYGTREYSAVLMNLPFNWERRLEACKATPLEVHGIAHMPDSCEDRGRGMVVGHWEINQYEPDCNTYWNWYKDKGCTSHGSGKRRIEHYLENLPMGGNWREFCATTPARFHGMEFVGAQECFQYNLGTYGHWEIDDVNC